MAVDADGADGNRCEPVTDPAHQSGAGRWGSVNAVLAVTVVVLLVGTVLLLARGPKATPGQSAAEATSVQYQAVTKAARAQTLAFLTVNYKDMDPLIAKVLAGATGTFKEEYDKAKVNIKATAQQGQSVSSGKVLSVGIGDMDAKSAVVFVAADSQVSNTTTKGETQPRYYRLQLNMVRKGDAWLTSNLQFVG